MRSPFGALRSHDFGPLGRRFGTPSENGHREAGRSPKRGQRVSSLIRLRLLATAGLIFQDVVFDEIVTVR